MRPFRNYLGTFKYVGKGLKDAIKQFQKCLSCQAIMRSTANSRVRILLILFAQVINTPQDECFYKFRVNFNISKYKISRLIITLKISSFSRRITETNKMDDANIGKP